MIDGLRHATKPRHLWGEGGRGEEEKGGEEGERGKGRVKGGGRGGGGGGGGTENEKMYSG